MLRYQYSVTMKRSFTLHYYAGFRKTGESKLELDCSKNSKVYHFCIHGDEKILIIDLDNRMIHTASVYNGDITSESFPMSKKNVSLFDFETFWFKGKGEGRVGDFAIEKKIIKLLKTLRQYGISYTTSQCSDEYVMSYLEFNLYLNCNLADKIESLNESYRKEFIRLSNKLFCLTYK